MFCLLRSRCIRKCNRVKQNLTFTTQLFLPNCNNNIIKSYIYLYIYIYCIFHSYCNATACKPIISVALNGIYRNNCSTKTEKQQEHAQQKNYVHDRSLSVLFNISLGIIHPLFISTWTHSDNFIPKMLFLGKTKQNTFQSKLEDL